MLYTIGKRDYYEMRLAEGKFYKRGQRPVEHYPGGHVFLNEEEAYKFLEKSGWDKDGYDVYGLLTTIENTRFVPSNSVIQTYGADVRLLKADAQVVSLEK